MVMVPACLILLRWHVLAAVVGGALAYGIALAALGGFRRSHLAILLNRS